MKPRDRRMIWMTAAALHALAALFIGAEEMVPQESPSVMTIDPARVTPPVPEWTLDTALDRT